MTDVPINLKPYQGLKVRLGDLFEGSKGVPINLKPGSSLLGMVRQGGINRLNPYLARDLIDQFALDQK